MSKEFAMINAARKLESYVSRERYNIDKMKTNHRVPESLYVTKAQQFNELLDTLNTLYGSLIDGASELFDDHYIQISQDVEDDVQYDTTDYSVVDDAPVMPMESEVVTLVQTPAVEESQPEPEPEQMQWQLDGFDSYDAWVALKEVESSEIANDLDISVSVEASKYKAGVALDTYDASKEQDIVDYDVEGDTPPDVLDDEDVDDDDLVEHDDEDYDDDELYDPDEDIDDETDSSDDRVDEAPDVDVDDGDGYKRPTEGLEYMHYTQENIRVDDDPTQIASVKTAVEIEGAEGQRGTDIDVDAFSYSEQSHSEFNVDDILGVDLDSYQTHTNNNNDDDDSDTYGGDGDDGLASEEYPAVSDYDSEEHYEPEDDSLFANGADNPHADIGDSEYDRVNDDNYDSNDSI